jgi:hypothetical protein
MWVDGTVRAGWEECPGSPIGLPDRDPVDPGPAKAGDHPAEIVSGRGEFLVRR